MPGHDGEAIWAATRAEAVPLPATAMAFGVLIPTLITLALIYVRNGGEFAYTMDAPYVHLALADQIRQGHYGLNAGEPASPSSSVGFPFLLALLPFGALSPLLICLASIAGAGALLAAIGTECGIRSSAATISALGLGTALALALNLPGLALMGLEHAPQVALTLASLLGVVRCVRRRRVDWWWPAALIALPLLRFETVPLVGANLLVMLALRQWRPVVIVVGAVGVAVGCFALHLASFGLSVVPHSIAEKSAAFGLEARGLNMVRALYANLRVNLLSFGGTHLLFALVVLGWGAGRAWQSRTGRREQAQLAAFVVFAVAVIGHLVAGSFASRSRYEVYLLALALGTFIVVFDRQAAAAIARPAARLALGVSLLLLGSGYALRTVDALKAAQAMHRTDDQAWRFVTQVWQGPVAVTRWGRLNHGNPYPVAPLPAATSQVPGAVLRARAAAIAEQYGVQLAVLQETGGTVTPRSWQRVGRLHSVWSGREHAILFLAVDPAEADRIRAALQAFALHLPPESVLRVFAEGD